MFDGPYRNLTVHVTVAAIQDGYFSRANASVGIIVALFLGFVGHVGVLVFTSQHPFAPFVAIAWVAGVHLIIDNWCRHDNERKLRQERERREKARLTQ